MKKIVLSCAIIISIFSITMAHAQVYSGKGLYLYGDSAANMGRGTAGVSSFGTDLFYLNPASIATLERLGLSLQYGNLGGNIYNPDITIAVPTSYGNIGGSFRLIAIPDAVDLKNAYSFRVGAAKDLTEKLMIGLGIDMVFGADLNENNLFYLGGSLGAIYKFSGMNKSRGFGIFDPTAGISVNAGIPLGNPTGSINFNSVTTGYAFRFFRHNAFDLGFYNDVSLVNYYKEFPIKFGLESLILDHYIVRTGGIALNGYDFGTFTAGVGYQFTVQNFAGSVNYSLAYDKKSKVVHYVGLNMEYGELDRQAPVTAVTPDQKYFSPNHDGVQDYVVFDINVEDRSRIKGWRLQIINPQSSVIREYRISDRDMVKGLTFKDFFSRLFSKKTSLDVPKNIMWDGTDAKGGAAPDGKYTYAFTAWDERDNIAEQKSGVVFIDTTMPEVKLAAKESLFSPNGDKQKDVFVIEQTIVTSPEDQWEAGFKNVEGIVVKDYSFEGSKVPGSVVWDGKDNNGNDAAEGLYYYYIVTKDKAGNGAQANIKEITLTRQYETADIRLEKSYLSYVIDKELRMYLSLSNAKGMEEYTVLIMDEKRKPVHELKGTGVMPGILTWNGKGAEGKNLDDGIYFVKLETRFNSGNTPSSFEKKLIVDSTPPRLSIGHSPDLFSPDGDEENDVLTISPEAGEDFGIREWKISISNPSGILFKSFSGTGNVPDKILWDGLSDDRDIVESAVDYEMVLEAVDLAGNIGKSKPEKISIDILVVVTERGLKMRISNIQFAFDSADLKKQGKKILDRVYVILQKYERYDIIIEGHTDDIGKEEYNLGLSERRAKSVMDYLVSNGTSKGRLQFVGMGETVPLYPNKNDENRRRNRRVEFLLIKKN
ncbi:MAG: hypothetical protein CVV44_00735 [Spirochaetae bacterium HGW-Spirochaetae-1]|nr:MAG: hypothetical protein CVV44_00735 [Spirochaetae bacterium HGW-Spirochaetae-1]